MKTQQPQHGEHGNIGLDRPEDDVRRAEQTGPTLPPVSGRSDRRRQLIRLAGSCLSLLVSGLFCQQFSNFQYHALVFGANISPRQLPYVCIWYFRYSPVLMALALIVFLIGLAWLLQSHDESVVVELLAQAALVTALLFLVGCILAWQVPYAPVPGRTI